MGIDRSRNIPPNIMGTGELKSKQYEIVKPGGGREMQRRLFGMSILCLALALPLTSVLLLMAKPVEAG